MSERITIDDIYDIAAEVAEETVKKFLTNLVKLVPTAESVVDSIKDSQYEELQNYRRSPMQESTKPVIETSPINTAARAKRPVISVDDLIDSGSDDFASIAHPQKASNNSFDIDDALTQIPLEKSDLFGQAVSSPVD